MAVELKPCSTATSTATGSRSGSRMAVELQSGSRSGIQSDSRSGITTVYRTYGLIEAFQDFFDFLFEKLNIGKSFVCQGGSSNQILVLIN